MIRSFPTRLVAGKVLLFAGLALAVSELSVVARADVAVANAIHATTTGWLTSLVVAISDLARTEVILFATIVIVGLLAGGRHWRGAAALALSVLATQAVVQALKLWVARPRPEGNGALADPSGFSFPSAHSASAMALYLMLALIAAGLLRRHLRTAAYVAAGAVVILVGISRVYLGAHYPTDVVAGWLIGASIVVGSWWMCSRLPTRAGLGATAT